MSGWRSAKHLREIGAVRVPVEVHAGGGERLQQRRQIVGRERGAVQRHPRAERASAGADVGFAQRAFLQLRALNRAGTAGTAVIHDEDVEAVAQRFQQREILLARLRGREAWPPLGRHQRAGRRPRWPRAGSTRNRPPPCPVRPLWDPAAAREARTRAPLCRSGAASAARRSDSPSRKERVCGCRPSPAPPRPAAGPGTRVGGKQEAS